jgi:hypothetical protein
MSPVSRFLISHLVVGALIVGLATTVAARAAAAGTKGGWDLEKDVDHPTYAFAEPASSDLNIDTVVLSCEQGADRNGLQLRLYLTRTGPLAPTSAGTPKAEPRFEIAIDGVRHEARLLFADSFIVVADTEDGATPLLSDRLVRALQRGRKLELSFDLVQEQAGQAPAFDGRAIVELQAGRGGSAVSTLRRCADAPHPSKSQHLAETPRGR